MNAQPVVDIPSLSLMDWWFSASSGITALRIQFLRGECILVRTDLVKGGLPGIGTGMHASKADHPLSFSADFKQ
jgi:hypothetical protein